MEATERFGNKRLTAEEERRGESEEKKSLKAKSELERDGKVRRRVEVTRMEVR